MKFRKDDMVQILSLKRSGVVLGKSKEGWFKVVVENVTVEAAEADLVALGKLKRSVPKTRRSKQLRTKSKVHSPSRSCSVDLHGMRVDEALSEITRRIDRALLDGVEQMEVVHGLGTGKVREALHKYLRTLSVVKHFKIDERNPGATWVYF